jgi:hypothetical protein
LSSRFFEGDVMRQFLAVHALLLFIVPMHFAASQPQRSFEELPDWSGVWQMIGRPIFDTSTVQPPNGRPGGPGVREFPPYNDEWEQKYVANIEAIREGRFPDPVTTCGTFPGFPRSMNVPGGFEFVVRPEVVWIITETGPTITRVYTDGRAHPPAEEIWPTFGGESVGRWEDDTLVFETIGLKGEGDAIVDRTGLVLSTSAAVTTRLVQIDDSTIEARMTIEDPVALAEPWAVTKQYERLPPGSRMFEVACAENNRNPVDESGRTLTLDADGNVLDVDIER